MTMSRRCWRGFPIHSRRGDAGQNLVAFALVLPFILMLTIGVMDVARVVMTYNALSYAAREGARYAITAEHPTNSEIKAHIIDSAPGIGIRRSEIKIRRRPYSVEVRITHATPLIFGPLIQAAGGQGVLSLSASSQMRLEQ